MINEHEFNTRWWGEPVGIVRDPEFFGRSDNERQAALAPFVWVEFASPLDSVEPDLLHRVGFFQSDTQLNFRIGLKQAPSSPSLDCLEVSFADERAFSIREGELAPFIHERFLYLPGISQSKLDSRYVMWGNDLIEENPDLCLQVLLNGSVAGWFLSKRTEGRGINLTLAMLHRDAPVSGLLLYQKAIDAYARRGEKLGWAAFSVTNTDVHNIYSNLGAHFLKPNGCWLWIRKD